MSTRALSIVRKLGMKPHPENGWYVESFRDERLDASGRPLSSVILYLLQAGETSEWHRVTDAAEVWHWHAGAPLVLTVSPNGHDAAAHRLGPDVLSGDKPHVVVPSGAWQTATSLGEYTLVGCTVTPAFSFEGFELAPKDWRPTPRRPG